MHTEGVRGDASMAWHGLAGLAAGAALPDSLRRYEVAMVQRTLRSGHGLPSSFCQVLMHACMHACARTCMFACRHVT